MRVVLQIVTGILLLLIGYCLHGMFSNCTIDESSTTVKNYYDSTIYKNYKVTNIYKGAIIRDTIPKYIDTTKVIEDYFFKHPYVNGLIPIFIYSFMIQSAGMDSMVVLLTINGFNRQRL